MLQESNIQLCTGLRRAREGGRSLLLCVFTKSWKVDKNLPRLRDLKQKIDSISYPPRLFFTSVLQLNTTLFKCVVSGNLWICVNGPK